MAIFFCGKEFVFLVLADQTFGPTCTGEVQLKVLDFLAVENNFECLCAPLFVYHPLEKIYTFHFQAYHGKIVFKGL